MAAANKLYRSNDSVLAGVCAGFAEYLDIDSVIVRILVVLVCFATGFAPMLLVYVAVAVILPRRPDVDPDTIPCAAYVPARQEPTASVQGEFPQNPQQPQQAAPQWQAVPQPGEEPSDSRALSVGTKTGVIIGLMLLFVGMAGFLGTVIADIFWWQLWPAFFLLAGLMVTMVPSRRMSFVNRFSLGISVMALSAVGLSVSVGVLSWEGVNHAFADLWPVGFIALGLTFIGSALRNGLFALAAAACVVACCIAALTVYAVPGYLGSITMATPFMESHLFDINPWS